MAYPRSPTLYQRLPLQNLKGLNHRFDPSSRISTPSTPSLTYYSESDSLPIEDEQDKEISSDVDFPPATLSSIIEMVDRIEEPTPQISPQLNPLAASFAPGQDSARRFSTAFPATQGPNNSGTRRHGTLPFWHAFFEPGARATKDVTIKSYARTLVSCKPWPFADVVQLVRYFTAMALHVKEGMSHRSLGEFARQVRCQFAEHFGEDKAQEFVFHLREAVLGTFKRAWKTEGNPRAVQYFSELTDARYVEAACSLSSFVGDLFAAEVFGPVDIGYCISILLYALNSHEHIDALELLLTPCGKRYWLTAYKRDAFAQESEDAADKRLKDTVNDFLGRFTPMAKTIKWSSSVLGRTMDGDQLELWIESVANLARQWISAVIKFPPSPVVESISATHQNQSENHGPQSRRNSENHGSQSRRNSFGQPALAPPPQIFGPPFRRDSFSQVAPPSPPQIYGQQYHNGVMTAVTQPPLATAEAQLIHDLFAVPATQPLSYAQQYPSPVFAHSVPVLQPPNSRRNSLTDGYGAPSSAYQQVQTQGGQFSGLNFSHNLPAHLSPNYERVFSGTAPQPQAHRRNSRGYDFPPPGLQHPQHRARQIQPNVFQVGRGAPAPAPQPPRHGRQHRSDTSSHAQGPAGGAQNQPPHTQGGLQVYRGTAPVFPPAAPAQASPPQNHAARQLFSTTVFPPAAPVHASPPQNHAARQLFSTTVFPPAAPAHASQPQTQEGLGRQFQLNGTVSRAYGSPTQYGVKSSWARGSSQM